ncbi:MAG: nuclear transport factor 2 family protein [Halioglobus sp.]
MSFEDKSALVNRFMSALEQADESVIRESYADNASIWHNFDGLEQSVDDNIASLHWLRGHLDDIRYADAVHSDIANGLLQRHVMRGKSASGATVALPACVIFTIVGGRITRLEEYLDPTPLLALLATK